MGTLKMLLLYVDGPIDVEPSTGDAGDALLMTKPLNTKSMSYLQ